MLEQCYLNSLRRSLSGEPPAPPLDSGDDDGGGGGSALRKPSTAPELELGGGGGGGFAAEYDGSLEGSHSALSLSLGSKARATRRASATSALFERTRRAPSERDECSF